METIKGREIADEIRIRVKEQVEASGFNPNLAIIVVGDDKQNLLYVGLKDKAVSFIGGTTCLLYTSFIGKQLDEKKNLDSWMKQMFKDR